MKKLLIGLLVLGSITSSYAQMVFNSDLALKEENFINLVNNDRFLFKDNLYSADLVGSDNDIERTYIDCRKGSGEIITIKYEHSLDDRSIAKHPDIISNIRYQFENKDTCTKVAQCVDILLQNNEAVKRHFAQHE